jgi:hypothetical protein
VAYEQKKRHRATKRTSFNDVAASDSYLRKKEGKTSISTTATTTLCNTKAKVDYAQRVQIVYGKRERGDNAVLLDRIAHHAEAWTFRHETLGMGGGGGGVMIAV